MIKSDLTQLKSGLDTAHMVALLLPKNPPYDTVAAALALKLSLQDTSKTVSIACPDPMTVEFNRLVGVDSITNSFGSRNFIISFPDQTDIVDKVSYNVEAGELQLVITPKPGTLGIDQRRLKFTSSGIQADLVICVGVDQLSDLGQIYHDTKDFLSTASLASLTHHTPQQNYTQTQISDTSASSLSEITSQLIESLGLPLSTDSASNLLAGLDQSTNHFQSGQISAATFETAALLLRHGARRQDIFVSHNLPSGSIPSVPSTPVNSSNIQGFGTDSQPVAPSPDWYEPKVFRGTNLS